MVGRVGINQRVSLRKFIDDIRRWVEEDRSDEWIASALGTSPSSVQSFRSRNAIYRRETYDNYPAARAIMSCVYEGLQLPIDAALRAMAPGAILLACLALVWWIFRTGYRLKA